MDDPSPPGLFAELPFYAAHFMDLALWEPFVRHVASRSGFECQRILPGLPGTYPTFIVDLANPEGQSTPSSIVVKFFGPLFDGAGSFQVERAMGIFIAKEPLCIHAPGILAEGQLTPDWCYLIFEHIPGVSIGQARQELPTDTLDEVAVQLGKFMRELHTFTATDRPVIPMGVTKMSWDGYVAFLEAQRAKCYDAHQHWHDLPPHLLAELIDFIPPVEQLIDLTSPSHLIHADLTADHLLGRLVPSDSSATLATIKSHYPAHPVGALPVIRPSTGSAGMGWESLAIIDWGDSRLGNILYELAALHFDLFQADKHLLHLCLQAYGLPAFYQQEFARKAFSMVLLHQFPMPTQIYAPHHDAQSLAELAERLFGL